ncbi:MAG: 16S rRNA (uracil(1498)-N(3))-methyltransferase [Pseudomonadota bacterium]
MPQPVPKIRLHLDAPLAEGAELALAREQAHYLGTVMRQAAGARVLVFNGRDGEWLAELTEAGRRGGRLRALEQTRAPAEPPDLWLLFAPVKKARTDFIVEKATELGCRRIQPVFTRRTNAERVRPDRLQAHAVEAAEQCGLVFVPEIAEPVALARLLERWDPARRILFCDERAAGFGGAAAALPAAARALGAAAEGAGPWAVLTGPEGGFAPEEAERLAAMPEAVAVGLGPRVLRADTAAVAALVLWQSVLGDWR